MDNYINNYSPLNHGEYVMSRLRDIITDKRFQLAALGTTIAGITLAVEVLHPGGMRDAMQMVFDSGEHINYFQQAATDVFGSHSVSLSPDQLGPIGDMSLPWDSQYAAEPLVHNPISEALELCVKHGADYARQLTGMGAELPGCTVGGGLEPGFSNWWKTVDHNYDPLTAYSTHKTLYRMSLDFMTPLQARLNEAMNTSYEAVQDLVDSFGTTWLQSLIEPPTWKIATPSIDTFMDTSSIRESRALYYLHGTEMFSDGGMSGNACKAGLYLFENTSWAHCLP